MGDPTTATPSTSVSIECHAPTHGSIIKLKRRASGRRIAVRSSSAGGTLEVGATGAAGGAAGGTENSAMGTGSGIETTSALAIPCGTPAARVRLWRANSEAEAGGEIEKGAVAVGRCVGVDGDKSVRSTGPVVLLLRLRLVESLPAGGQMHWRDVSSRPTIDTRSQIG